MLTDLRYARKQLIFAHSAVSTAARYDAIDRAQDAIERVIEAAERELAPVSDEWTVDEILAREA